MMAPSLALDADGPALAIGSAGGTRLRTALVGVAAGVLDEGLDPSRRRSTGRASIRQARPSTPSRGVDDDGLARARGGRVGRPPSGPRPTTTSAG